MRHVGSWTGDRATTLRRRRAVLLAAAVLAGAARPAYAYIDPATTGLVSQALVAVVAGVAAFGSLYWKKLRAFVGGKKYEPPAPPEEGEPDA